MHVCLYMHDACMFFDYCCYKHCKKRIYEDGLEEEEDYTWTRSVAWELILFLWAFKQAMIKPIKLAYDPCQRL